MENVHSSKAIPLRAQVHSKLCPFIFCKRLAQRSAELVVAKIKRLQAGVAAQRFGERLAYLIVHAALSEAQLADLCEGGAERHHGTRFEPVTVQRELCTSLETFQSHGELDDFL